MKTTSAFDKARRALDLLGYAVVGTGGGCSAYTRELNRRSSMVVVAGDCVPPTRVRGEPIFVGFYDAEGRGLTLEFADLAHFLFARDPQSAFGAWREVAMTARRVVAAPAAILEWLAKHRAPLGLVAATDAALRAGDIAQLVQSEDGAWLLGLFGAAVLDIDLTSFGFWAGPGAWICVLDA